MPNAGTVFPGALDNFDDSNRGDLAPAINAIEQQITTFLGGTAITSATSAISNSETVLENIALVPNQTLIAGSHVRVTMLGTCTTSAANASTWTIRAGTAGTTSDTSLATAAVTAATSGTTIAFHAILEFTVRTVGTGGTLAGSLTVTNTGTTGIQTTATNVIPFTSSALNTTTATFLDITYKTAAGTTASTFQNVLIEVLT